MPIHAVWLGRHYFASSVNEGENDGADANANIQDEWVWLSAVSSLTVILSYGVAIIVDDDAW